MAAADPQARVRSARIAADVSWARTPNRTERTAPATRNSPVSFDYWLNRITEEGEVRPADRRKAAASAHRAYMRQLAAKAAAKRSAKRAATR